MEEKCHVLGCALPGDPEFPQDSSIGRLGYFCRPHGLHYQTEDELWKLTNDRIRRAQSGLSRR